MLLRLLFVVATLALAAWLFAAGTPRPSVRNTVLTNREHDICRMVMDGLSNKEVAAKLGVSQIAVKHHMTRILDKTDTTTRTHLAIHYYQRYVQSTKPDPLDSMVIYG